MSKFLGTAAVEIKDMIVYKFEVLVWSFLNPILFLVYYFLWKAIYNYSGQASIGSFSFQGLVAYYGLTLIVSILTWTNIDQNLSNRVQRGTLANILLKPINTFTHYLYEKLADTTFSFSVQAIPLIILAALTVNLSTNVPNFILFSISAILAMLLSFAFTFFIGLSSFWLTQYSGLRMLRSGALWFLSGNVIPLTFFPAAWQAVSNFLPFQYLAFSPIQIFLGAYSIMGSLAVIGIQLIWIAILLVAVHFGLKAALKQFSAVGQ